MRISDWSSDVCSSDLEAFSPFGRYLLARKRRRCASGPRQGVRRVRRGTMKTRSGWRLRALGALAVAAGLAAAVPAEADDWNIVEIGRTSCRERVCQYV